MRQPSLGLVVHVKTVLEWLGLWMGANTTARISLLATVTEEVVHAFATVATQASTVRHAERRTIGTNQRMGSRTHVPRSRGVQMIALAEDSVTIGLENAAASPGALGQTARRRFAQSTTRSARSATLSSACSALKDTL